MISLFWVKSSKISIQGVVYIFGKNFQGSANKSKRFMLVIRFCKVSFFFPEGSNRLRFNSRGYESNNHSFLDVSV